MFWLGRNYDTGQRQIANQQTESEPLPKYTINDMFIAPIKNTSNLRAIKYSIPKEKAFIIASNYLSKSDFMFSLLSNQTNITSCYSILPTKEIINKCTKETDVSQKNVASFLFDLRLWRTAAERKEEEP